MDFSFLFGSPKYHDVSSKFNFLCSLKDYPNIIINSDLQVNVIDKKSDSCIKLNLKNTNDVGHVKYTSSVSNNSSLVLNFSTDTEVKGFIEIYVPKLQSLSITVNNDDINITNVHSKLISTNSRSGDIKVSDSNFNNLQAVTVNGDITVSLKESAYQLKLTTETGEIVKNLKNKKGASKSILCCTTNGDIYLKVTNQHSK